MNPHRPTTAATSPAASCFGRTATGLGTAALGAPARATARATALAARADRSGGLPGLPHFAPKAKRVIYLFQNGAPSHVDLFDYKPKLHRAARQADPASRSSAASGSAP